MGGTLGVQNQRYQRNATRFYVVLVHAVTNRNDELLFEFNALEGAFFNPRFPADDELRIGFVRIQYWTLLRLLQARKTKTYVSTDGKTPHTYFHRGTCENGGRTHNKRLHSTFDCLFEETCQRHRHEWILVPFFVDDLLR